MSAIITFAPSATNSSAWAAPMLLADPVMRATLPASLFPMFVFLLSRSVLRVMHPRRWPCCEAGEVNRIDTERPWYRDRWFCCYFRIGSKTTVRPRNQAAQVVHLIRAGTFLAHDSGRWTD